jgi:hypothetical protein
MLTPSSPPAPTTQATPIQDLAAKITEIDAEIERLDDEIGALKDQRYELFEKLDGHRPSRPLGRARRRPLLR